jgi:hypothetical protein
MLRCGMRAESQNAFTLYALKSFQRRIFDLMKSVPNMGEQEESQRLKIGFSNKKES